MQQKETIPEQKPELVFDWSYLETKGDDVTLRKIEFIVSLFSKLLRSQKKGWSFCVKSSE
jgi:hypothetical protein